MTTKPDNSGLLVIDKPQGVTSHDVVAAVRGALHMKLKSRFKNSVVSSLSRT